MHVSRLVVVLPLFALAGCWPYLGGPYEDYVDGEGTDDVDTSDRDTSDRDTSDRDTSDRDTDDVDTDDPDTGVVGDGPTLFGVFSNIQYMGGYWGEEPSLAIQSAFIVAGEPGLGWTYGSTYPAPGECSSGSTVADDAFSLGIDAGLASAFAVQTSSRTVELTTWDNDPNVRIGNNNDLATMPANAVVTIDTSVDEGVVDGVFTRTPSDFSWTQPTVDGAQMVIVPREPFNVAWSGTTGDTVIATWLFQNGSFETLGGAICTIPELGFSIDPATAPPNTEFIQLRLERIREYSGTVSGTAGVESVVAGALEKRGYVALAAE